MILMDQMNKNIDDEKMTNMKQKRKKNYIKYLKNVKFIILKWLQNLVKNQEMEQTNEHLSSTINIHPNIIHDIKILKN